MITNSSFKNILTLIFDSWTTDRKTINTGVEIEIHLGRATNVNSPKFLIVAHQIEK